jgi:hypothetical protein
MKKLLPLLFLLPATVVFGQLKNFSFSLSTNSPVIGDAVDNSQMNLMDPTTGFTSYTTTTATLRESYDTKPGLNFSFDFQAYEFGKYFIRTGLGLQYYRYQRTVTVESIGQDQITLPINPIGPVGSPIGVIVGSVYPRDQDGNIIVDPVTGLPVIGSIEPLQSNPNLGKTTTLHLQIPVTIGRKFLRDRLVVSAGTVGSFILHATEAKEEYSLANGINEYKDKSTNSYNAFLLGGVADVTYFIHKQIGIKLSYQRSFNPIYKSDYQAGGKTYFNILSAGVTFQLLR